MSSKASCRPTPWRTVLIVCRKCGKKLDGGFGRKRKETLRTVLREGRTRDVRVFETGCMGICPKGGVTALNATRPGMIHVIPAGADRAEVMATLLGGDVAPTHLGGQRAPTHLGGDRAPTHLGGDVAPTHLGGDVAPTHLGGDRAPTHLGGDRAPTLLGRDLVVDGGGIEGA